MCDPVSLPLTIAARGQNTRLVHRVPRGSCSTL